MKILVTGADGFIGKNLKITLSGSTEHEVIPFTRRDTAESLSHKLLDIDAVIHLAGVNRPDDEQDFVSGNRDFTELLCRTLEEIAAPVHVLFASSIQAELDNPYGSSKLAAEKLLEEFSASTGNPVSIFRLPNVFGKWCRPAYNSVVATFCHHIAHDQAIEIHDPEKILRLVYIDDVVQAFLLALKNPPQGAVHINASPEYSISLGELATRLYEFRNSRDSLCIEEVGQGLLRALYATYLSYLEPENFSYDLPVNTDERGKFVEVLKTVNSGQFSFFTAHPGITRGGHYHHTKNEKFLVVHGEALFRFRHLVDNRQFELRTRADQPRVVDTIPGWAHDITNVGKSDLVVMLWANEIFDKERPDTVRAVLDE